MKDRTERAYRFETLQLHVGQEQADPATDARAVRFTRHPHTCSMTAKTQRQDSRFQQGAIYTEG